MPTEGDREVPDGLPSDVPLGLFLCEDTLDAAEDTLDPAAWSLPIPELPPLTWLDIAPVLRGLSECVERLAEKVVALEAKINS